MDLCMKLFTMFDYLSLSASVCALIAAGVTVWLARSYRAQGERMNREVTRLVEHLREGKLDQLADGPSEREADENEEEPSAEALIPERGTRYM